MTYLLGPYTWMVLQLFQSAAWLFYFGIVTAILGGIILVSRTAIWKSSSGPRIHIRPATFEALGLILLILGLILAAPGADALSQTFNIGSAGPSLQQCSDLSNIACFGVGGSGSCTPANIGTTACNLPANGCDGVYRVGIGRCEKGSVTPSITAGSTSATSTITFSPAFTNAPFLAELTPVNPPVIGTLPTFTTPVDFLNEPNFQYKVPIGATATEFPGNASLEVAFDPSSPAYTSVQLVVTVSTNTPPSGSSIEVDYSSDGSSTWTTLVSFLDDLTGGPCNQIIGGVTAVMCSGFVNMPAVTSATNGALRIATKNGDGTTVVTFNQIQAQFRGQVNLPIYPSGGTPTTTQIAITLTIPFKISGSVQWAFRWQAVSYTG